MIHCLNTTNAKKILIGVVIIGLGLLVASQASAQYGDLDCADFGTRERAQHEFNQMEYDQYRLDRDSDGKVCELKSFGWTIAVDSWRTWISGWDVDGTV